jgi:hypothetical protein
MSLRDAETAYRWHEQAVGWRDVSVAVALMIALVLVMTVAG